MAQVEERMTVATSFDEAKPGTFESLETSVGTWIADAGQVLVDDKHAKTGAQCLQLGGGEKTVVTLQLADGADTSGILSFWAERWTSRNPFSFRIEKDSGDGWKEIYNGDATVRVGRAFLNYVKVPLVDEHIQKLRFTCTSPPATGILIDDIRIAPAQPQRIQSVEALPFTLPALIGGKYCSLAKLKIVTTGILNPLSVTELQAEIEGIEFLESLQFGDGEFVSVSSPASPEVAVRATRELTEGENIVWLKCRLNDDADIDQRVGAAVQRVTFSNGEVVKLDVPVSLQRMGVAVRNGGDNGVHTFRIPGLATTNQGTLIAVYDVRYRGGGDLPGDIDVGMSRSTDGGRTWEPMKVIMDMGDDPKWSSDGIGDPAVLVDRNTGTIWVAGTWSHGNRSWNGSGPGLNPAETGQLMLVRSDDDGATWSDPINITEQVKRPEWCFILQGPGKGITMSDGTIVFAAQYQDPPEKRRLPHSTIIYSQDHGETWHVGTGAHDDTTESQVVEVEPGVLMLNCRYNRKSARVVMTTRDMGATWQKHPTSERALIEPGTCMASLINVDAEVGKDVGNWLLFSNPDSLRGRNHLTIKASSDNGKSWPKQHRLLLDEGSSAGYSCMSMIDEETIGILYEGSQAHMTFQRVPLEDVIGAGQNGSNSTGKSSDTNSTPSGTSSRYQTMLSLPQVFSSHMVLQANAPLPVWGNAKRGSKVTVQLGNETLTTSAGDDGRWLVRFPARKATSVPTSLVVQSGIEQVSFRDVLIGEVWVCAGQSNMEWQVDQSTNGPKELSSLAETDVPNIRLLDLTNGPRGASGPYTTQELGQLHPESFVNGQWETATADAVSEFSAVGWYFGRRLQADLNVPIGLICPAVGGSPAEAWIPRDALARDDELKQLVSGCWLDNPLLGEFCPMRGEQNLIQAIQAGESIPGDDLGFHHPFKPGFLWSAGIEPLIPYAIRGVIWYQGESNAETPQRVLQHEKLFPLLVTEWRQHWQQGDFPFLFVQLPSLNRPDWPQFRDGQRRFLGQLPNVGMAVTMDVGHPTDVHPHQKKPVGERLALWALGMTYQSKSQPVWASPLCDEVERRGNSLVVSFQHSGTGLKTSDGKPIRHFEICGPDGTFYAAKADIVNNGQAVAVSSKEVAEPTAVRYAWQPFPSPPVNLVNSADLPASPFLIE
ncbi:MAG: exo-alpha-sialidase [Planctomycetaceae bacterium]